MIYFLNALTIKKKQFNILPIEAGLAPGGGGRIAITQPRRVAAVSVASRVADEIGCR